MTTNHLTINIKEENNKKDYHKSHFDDEALLDDEEEERFPIYLSIPERLHNNVSGIL